MKEPGICPQCGSDRVEILDSRLYGSDARWRWRRCLACGEKYTSVVLTEAVGDVLLTIESVARLRPSSVLELRRTLQRFRSLL